MRVVFAAEVVDLLGCEETVAHDSSCNSDVSNCSGVALALPESSAAPNTGQNVCRGGTPGNKARSFLWGVSPHGSETQRLEAEGQKRQSAFQRERKRVTHPQIEGQGGGKSRKRQRPTAKPALLLTDFFVSK